MENETHPYYQSLYKSKGHQKLLNYFREVRDTKDFQDFINTARSKYKIPEKGFLTKGDIISFPPSKWFYYNNEKVQRELFKKIRNLCKKFYIHYLDGSELIEGYLFYNLTEHSVYPDTYNMCIFADLVEQKKDPFLEETQIDDNLFFPIAIRISPYASQRDIIDYIRRAYKNIIVPNQDKYKIPGVNIGKYKKRKSSIVERNKFIYENQNLPLKEISRLVEERFGSEHSLDYGYIGKIISLEKRKRFGV